jgi:hypothetical protein
MKNASGFTGNNTSLYKIGTRFLVLKNADTRKEAPILQSERDTYPKQAIVIATIPKQNAKFNYTAP